MKRLAIAALLVSAISLSPTALAQNDGEEAPGKFDEHIHMQVRVVTESDRAIARTVTVRLMYQREPTPLVTVSTNSEGVADFNVPRTGNFVLEVSGPGVETTTSTPFTVTKYDHTVFETVQVKLKGNPSLPAATGVASTSSFTIPKEATQEFDAGVASMHEQKWAAAATHFQSAIDRYPKFDQAYDNLGIARQNSGDVAGAKLAYQKAIELNDHNANAQRDLARVLEGEKDWPAAETLLGKSLAVDPNNAGSLTLLSIAQIEQGKLDDAIASAGRVHALEHKSYPIAHLVLARAYEMKSQKVQAVAEYQLFLAEDPKGPRSEMAKKKLAALNAAAE